jgi:hypothetical protein
MELSKEKLIELYDIIFPRSLEDDNDIKSIEMKEILDDRDTVIIQKMSELKIISKWMFENGLWS